MVTERINDPPFLAHSCAADPHSMLLMVYVTPSSWRCVW